MTFIKPAELKQLQQMAINKAINNSAGNPIVGNNSTSLNFKPSDFYMDDRNYGSAHNAAFELQKGGSSLFNRRIMDNACNVEKELSIAYSGVKGEELDKLLEAGNAIWTIDQREDTNNDGVIDESDELVTTTLLDAIVDSYDSELDLYIEAKMQEVIEKYGSNCKYNLKSIFGSHDSEALKELASYGIVVNGIGDHDKWQNRTYTFSLVDVSQYNGDIDKIMTAMYGDGTYDENGIANGKVDLEILQDANGKKGSIIFSDCLTADGTAQGAEMNLSSILDSMGYDCVSKADYLGKEDEYYELLENIQTGLDNDAFAKSGATIETLYGETLTGIEAINAVYDVNSANRFMVEWSREANTFEFTRGRVRSGHYKFGGGWAKEGQIIDYGYTTVKPEVYLSDLNEELNRVLEKVNDVNLTQEERNKAKEEAKEIQKQIDEAVKKSEEYIKHQEEMAQQGFENAVNEAQKAVDEANKNGKDAKEIIEKIAKEYGLDADEIIKEIDM